MRFEELLARVRGDGLTFVALPAVPVPAAAIVAAWPDAPAVAWCDAARSSGDPASPGVSTRRRHTPTLVRSTARRRRRHQH